MYLSFLIDCDGRENSTGKSWIDAVVGEHIGELLICSTGKNVLFKAVYIGMVAIEYYLVHLVSIHFQSVEEDAILR